MIVLLIICFFFVIAAGSIIIHSIINGISPMPSSGRAKKRIIETINSIPPGGRIYELGSGWGSIIFPMAGRFPESEITAIENSPVPYLFSKCLGYIFFYRNLIISRENFYEVPLLNADVIFTYLHPNGMKRLKEKFEKELKKNTVVISNTFAVPGWKPVKVNEVSDMYHSKLYVYVIGKTSGTNIDIKK